MFIGRAIQTTLTEQTDRNFLFFIQLMLKYGPFGSKTLFCQSQNSESISLLKTKSKLNSKQCYVIPWWSFFDYII